MAIAENISSLQEKIRQTALEAKRNPADVTLLAVSKYATVDAVQEAYSCGLRDFGENRLQEGKRKVSQAPGDVNWHFIGHLQTNKVKEVISHFSLIHSLDRYKLAARLSQAASLVGKEVRVLIQVNIAQEKSKNGLAQGEVQDFLDEVVTLPNLKVEGLMAMAPFVENPEEVRPYFRQMKQIYDTLTTPGVSFKHLSMGMSNDFSVAVEEGATLIRIGSLIFSDID